MLLDMSFSLSCFSVVLVAFFARFAVCVVSESQVFITGILILYSSCARPGGEAIVSKPLSKNWIFGKGRYGTVAFHNVDYSNNCQHCL